LKNVVELDSPKQDDVSSMIFIQSAKSAKHIQVLRRGGSGKYFIAFFLLFLSYRNDTRSAKMRSCEFESGGLNVGDMLGPTQT
jgi:hypothetical protein